MAKKAELDQIAQGVDAWNSWKSQNPDLKLDLTEANLSGLDLSKIDFSEVDLSQARAENTNLNEANLSKVTLDGGVLLGATLRRANLRGSLMNYANLCRADLTQADLSYSRMAHANLSGAILPHAILHNADLRLSLAEEADFRFATMTYANLTSASLKDALLAHTNFRHANLRGAYLERADMSNSDLRNANLIGADFREVNLLNTNLCYSDLSGANLQGSILGLTIFGDSTLSGARGLSLCTHVDKSIVDPSTILNSGDIPGEFLRGAGFSEQLLEELSHISLPRPAFYSCFISYSTKDEVFATQLYADLMSKRINCWFAPEHLKIGERLRDGIDESIRAHDKMLLVLSKHSIASNWVEKEVESAMALERQQRRTILFPIRLDNDAVETAGGWPEDIRLSRNIGDFTRWQDPEAYGRLLEKLIRDLKAK